MWANYESVSTAAETLVRKGEIPTIAAVRAALGEGSNSTVGKYLELWKTEKIQQAVIKVTPSDEVTRAVHHLLQKMQGEVEIKLAESQTEARCSIENAQAAQQKAEEGQAVLSCENERLGHEVNLLRENMAQAEKALLEMEALNCENKKLADESASLKEQLAQAQQSVKILEIRLAEQEAHHQTRLQDKEKQISVYQAEKERFFEKYQKQIETLIAQYHQETGKK